MLKTVIYFSLPYLLSYFFADTLRHGGSVYYRAVWRRGWDDGGLGRQSGHAYADGYDRWSGDGRNGSHRTRGRRGDRKLAARGIGNTISLFAGLSILLTGLLLTAVHGIIRLLSVPEEAVNGTAAYLMICFAGIPFITAYNIISSIFRGMGDSKSPMYFVAIAWYYQYCAWITFLMGVFCIGPSGGARHDPVTDVQCPDRPGRNH